MSPPPPHQPRAGVLALGRGHVSHIVKMHHFFQNLLLYSQAYIRQTKFKVFMTNEWFSKIVTIMTPKTGLLMLGRLYKSLSWICIIFLSINKQHIDCYWLSEYDAAYLFDCWFSFILWWDCWYTNISPFWQEVGVKSLILRWPLRPVGL